MSYLGQFRYGQDNKIVTGYSHLDAIAVVMRHYKNLLDERHGTTEVLAHAYIKKALNWSSKLDEVHELDEFILNLFRRVSESPLPKKE